MFKFAAHINTANIFVNFHYYKAFFMRFRQFFTGHISLSLMGHAGDDQWIVKMFIINTLREKWAKVRNASLHQ